MMDHEKKTKVKQIVNVNEELLIKEIQAHPILYDTSLKGYRKTILRENIWTQIAINVNSTSPECRKRWRSLRDAFTKHYKGLQQSSDSKRKKWVFYDQMLFLAQYINSANSIQESIQDNSHDAVDDILLEPNEEIKLPLITTITSTQTIPQQTQLQNNHNLNHENPFVFSGPFTTTASAATTIGTLSTLNTLTKKEEETQVTNIVDSDESFLLSCAPILRRMSHRKNALARLKIQEILFQIEFESD